MPEAPGLSDDLREEGLWWIAGSEEHKVGGTLTFDQTDGAELKLLGTLRSIPASFGFSSDTDDAPIIYGTTKRGKSITLMGTINRQRQFNMPGIANEVWFANLLVVGIHLISDSEESIFSKSYFRFTGIEKWMGHDPFQTAYDDKEKSLELRVQKTRESALAGHADFDLITSGSLYSTNETETRFSIDASCDLGLVAHEGKSLRWHLSAASKVTDLATLCSGHPLSITRLELQGPETRKVGDQAVKAEVHVYALMMHSNAKPLPKKHIPVVSGPELFTLNPKALQLWFDQYENLSSAIALFRTVVSEPDLYSNIRFLLAMQAVEVFHRRTSNETVLPDGDFLKLKKSLEEGIPKGIATNMKDKLRGLYQFLNEPSLMQRLKSLVQRLDDETGVKVPAFERSYLRRLVETRNYYTHFSNENETKKLDGGGMYWATRRIVLFLTILYLERLGVSPSDLLAHLQRKNEFARLLSSDSDP